MWPYLMCFGLTGLMAYYNEKKNQKEDRNPWISALLVILIPAILAGLRDYSIGTDTKNVIKTATDMAGNIGSLKSLILFTQGNALFERFDIGYSVFVFIFAKILHNPQITMFTISFLTGLFVYLSLYKMRNECSILMGELIFLLTQYNASYNIIRQSLAMSMGLFALSIVLCEEKKRYLKAIIIILVAMLLHSSAFLSFIPIIIYAFYNEKRKTSLFRDSFFILALIVIVTSTANIVAFLINHGVINERYAHYFTEGQISRNFSIVGIIIYFFSYFFFLLGVPLIGKNKKFYIAIGLLEIALFGLTNISFYLYRIASYIMFIRILSFSQHSIFYVSPNSKAKIPLQYGLWCGILGSQILYFAYFTIYCNLNETYPFSFIKNL